MPSSSTEAGLTVSSSPSSASTSTPPSASTRCTMSSRFAPASTIAHVTVGSRLSSISRAQRRPVAAAGCTRRSSVGSAAASCGRVRSRLPASLICSHAGNAEPELLARREHDVVGIEAEVARELAREHHGRRRRHRRPRSPRRAPCGNTRRRGQPRERLDERALQLGWAGRHAGSAGRGDRGARGASRNGR